MLVDAVRDCRISHSGGYLDLAAVDKLCDELAFAGVVAREAVGVSLENGGRCTATYVALARMNAVAVCLPPAGPVDVRAHLMGQMGCRAIVTDAGVESVRDGKAPARWPDDIHWILHSSGSTGFPKPIALTWAAVEKNSSDTMRTLTADRDYLHLGTMSQCYANGLFNSFLLPLATGGRVHVGPVATVAGFGSFQRAISGWEPDILWVNPTVVSALLRRSSAADLQTVKMLISCTAPLSHNTCMMAEQALQRPVLQSYGLAETLIVSVERLERSAKTEFSAGELVGGPRSAGISEVSGTLEIANGAVTPGYVRLEAGEVVCELPDGLAGERFVSADRAEFDEAGRLHVLGRLTGVINVGGVKVGAEQLEAVLRHYPGVADAFVAAVPVAEGRERPGALVETDMALNLEELALHCVGTLGVAARPVLLRAVRRLPTTSNGKVDRRAAEAILLEPRE